MLKVCPVCTKIFNNKPKYRCCSRTCSGKYQTIYRSGSDSPVWKGGPVEVECLECEKKEKVNKAYARIYRYCSRKCYGDAQKKSAQGQNNPNWKGGIHPLGIAIRNSERYKQWRNEVFNRDKFTCKDCKQIGGNLEAHHIKAFSLLYREFLLKFNNFSPLEEKEILLRLADTYSDFWKLKNGKTLCVKCHTKLTTRPDVSSSYKMLYAQEGTGSTISS